MSEVVVEIVKIEETEKNGIKYLNINVSNNEVERNPDIVRICADTGILEYVKPKTGHWLMPDKEYSSKIWRKCSCCGTHIEKYSKYISFDGEVHYIPYRLNYCYVCGTRMVEPQESEET